MRWPATTRCPLCGNGLLFEMWLEYGGWRLLELEEERIVRAGGLQQQDVGAKPDTADPDHFAGDVGDGVPIKKESPIDGQ